MKDTDVITIVKRLAKAWKYAQSIGSIEGAVAYGMSLEKCGLTLTEIVRIGNSDDMDKIIEEMFKYHPYMTWMSNQNLLANDKS